MRQCLNNQRGAGLIEIMISITLGLLLLVFLLKSYDDSKATFRVQDSISRLQENARYAMHLISHDMRMAGYRGCVRDSLSAGARNTLNTPSAFLYDFETPVQGFEGNTNGSWTPTLDPGLSSVATGTDVLVIRGTPGTAAFLTQDMANTTSDIKLAENLNPPPVEVGDIVMLSDCLGSAVFQITQYISSQGTIVHDTDATNPPPGNVSKDLGRRYPAGAQLFKISTTSYFIRSGNNGPALWRKLGLSPAQELIEGVQNMQVQYGLDIDGDLMPDSYVNAAAAPDFRQVVSIRLALLFRSTEIASTDKDQRTFTLLDHIVGPFDDGRMYKEMSTTITLRNRAI